MLYLKHGGVANEARWTLLGKVNFIMDNLLAESKAVPFIIVMNNAMMQVNTDGNPRLDTGKFNEMVIRDCIPSSSRITAPFPTKKPARLPAFPWGPCCQAK